MNPQDAWRIAYNQIELQLDRANFDTWVRGAEFLRLEEGVFVIGVRNNYARDMLQHRLYRTLWRVLSDVWGSDITLRFEIHQNRPEPKLDDMPLFRLLAEQQKMEQTESRQPLHRQIARPEAPILPESELNPRFTFERFIVSNANRMAYEAARAVTENPGRNYNPFMLYGGVGLGKTHLLQAIANQCKSRGLRVVYVPSEAFTNDLVDSIRQRTTAMFREKYRSVDVLLVDDVQFISGKDSTQEEFFHTFNALYTFNKQIILASDRHPSELSTLEDRLRSRFEGGLVVDIPMLEYETRVAIVEMWMQERGIRLAPSIIEMVAERAKHNIRELEGVFNQVLAKAHLTRQPLTLDAATSTLQRFEAPRQYGKRMVIKVGDVIRLTAQHYQLKPGDLTGKSRTQRINLARQVAMYLARELCDLSLPQIGDAFGGRSHTTMMHGSNKVAEAIDLNDPVSLDVSKIRRMLLEGIS